MVLLDLSLSVRHRSAQGSAVSQILDSFFWIFQSLLWRGAAWDRDRTARRHDDDDSRCRPQSSSSRRESRVERERGKRASHWPIIGTKGSIIATSSFLSFFLRSFPPVLPQSIDPLLYKVIARPGAIFTIVGQDRMSAHSALFPSSLAPSSTVFMNGARFRLIKNFILRSFEGSCVDEEIWPLEIRGL